MLMNPQHNLALFKIVLGYIRALKARMAHLGCQIQKTQIHKLVMFKYRIPHKFKQIGLPANQPNLNEVRIRTKKK